MQHDNVIEKKNAFIAFKGNQLLSAIVITKVVKLLTKCISRLIKLEVTESLLQFFSKIE